MNYNKHFYTLVCLLALVTTTTMAIPAKRGIWRTLTLTDGTEIRAQLTGDEFSHHWEAADGSRYISNDDEVFRLMDAEEEANEAGARRRLLAQQGRQARRAHSFRQYTGHQKGLIILVEFDDTKFLEGHTRELFDSIANTEGYTSEEGFVGSAYDYFKAQSNGMFELTFDVVGPVTMPNGYAYYGKDSGGQGNDAHAGTMVAAACEAIADSVNFADYDWDGDGEVDQVMVIYAGYGQADGGNANTIWPHEYQLQYSDYGKRLELNDMIIDTYACANEQAKYLEKINGIGTLCHEFSHCMGLMDMYDTNYHNYGMGMWSIMDTGSYNGDGYRPAGYSSFDRMSCGWVPPIELTDEEVVVTDLQPLSEGGDAYIIRNDAWDDEYYLLENRQLTGWDADLPGNGLLILHVDYDPGVWAWNAVNTIGMYYDENWQIRTNNHQRCTIFHADNSSGTYSANDLAGDPYPYQDNDSLTNTSKPAAITYNNTSRHNKMMNRSVTSIVRNDDLTMGFRFSVAPVVVADTSKWGNGIMFYESFDQCSGKGGNDDRWSGSAGTATFLPDNEGWDALYMRGGDQCARFGTGTKLGTATTPAFLVNGTCTLEFTAAPWKNDGDTLRLSVDGNVTVSPAEFVLTQEQWSQCTATITGEGVAILQFTPSQRFFLDEVKVTSTAPTAISDVPQRMPASKAQEVYDLSGRRISGLDMRPGIYIVNGKKVVK